jgi:DNA replication protein DnaC
VIATDRKTCHRCGGRGYTVIPEAHGSGKTRRCACRQLDLRAWLKRAGVPEVVLADALEPWDETATSEPSELWEWAARRGWEKDGPVGFLLLGAPGRGKSKAAALALGRACTGRWYEAPSTARLVFHEARELGHSPTRTLLVDQPFAVIDDFAAEGNEKLTAEVQSWIWARYTKRRPTIVTTNLLEGGLDPRLLSRMADWSVVRMAGDDYRIRRAANQ